MIQKYLKIALYAVALIIMSACSNDSNEEDSYLYLDSSPIQIGSNGGSTSRPISSNIQWKVSKSDDWLQVSPISGSGNGTLKFDISPNLSPYSREANITIGSNAGNYTLHVRQNGNDNNTGGDNTGGDNTGGDNTGGDNTGGDNTSGGNTPTKPSAPSGLNAYWDGPASSPYVFLSWNSVSNATSYTVYKSTSVNGSYSRIGNSSYSGYSDNNVSIGKTYYYKVTASNSTGTSDYSNYTSVTLEDRRKPGPVTYGNCTATSTSITLRWTIPTDPSFGKPNKIILRLYEPTYKTWVDAQELSGTATSVTFNFGMWIDSDGYV